MLVRGQREEIRKYFHLRREIREKTLIFRKISRITNAFERKVKPSKKMGRTSVCSRTQDDHISLERIFLSFRLHVNDKRYHVRPPPRAKSLEELAQLHDVRSLIAQVR